LMSNPQLEVTHWFHLRFIDPGWVPQGREESPLILQREAWSIREQLHSTISPIDLCLNRLVLEKHRSDNGLIHLEKDHRWRVIDAVSCPLLVAEAEEGHPQ
jgi:hypothetical protein